MEKDEVEVCRCDGLAGDNRASLLMGTIVFSIGEEIGHEYCSSIESSAMNARGGFRLERCIHSCGLRGRAE